MLNKGQEGLKDGGLCRGADHRNMKLDGLVFVIYSAGRRTESQV